MDVSRLGGISGKGLTLTGSAGNKGMRVYETPSGMLKASGWKTPGCGTSSSKKPPTCARLGPR
jgi:dihydroorotate dehydrogenase (NAD+) catalytic subunit